METNIVQWIQYDNKIKEYNEKLKLLRDEREKISKTMIETVSNNEQLEIGNPVNSLTRVWKLNKASSLP